MQDVEEWQLYPVGIRAKNALMGEIVCWDSYPSRDVFELQQSVEGCREIAAGVVPPNKNAVGWPPIGDLVELQLAAKAPVIVVIRVMANGGPASPCREPGKPDGWRLAVLFSWGHQIEKSRKKIIAWGAQHPRPQNHFGACWWVVSVISSRGGCAQSLPC